MASSLTDDESPLPSFDEVTWKTGLPHLVHHVHMTVSMLLLFIAYNSVQNLASSIGSTGYYALASIYGSLCLSTLLVAGSFVSYFKPKISLIFGCLCYLTFIIANRWPTTTSLIPTAIVLGFGGAILWAAQGTYLTHAASNYSRSRNLPRTASMGLFTGIFFGIFQMSQVIGNLIAGFLLSGSPTEETQHLLMYIYIGIASAGGVSFLFLVPENPVEEEEKLKLHEKLFRAVLLLKDKRMLLLIATIFYSGIEQTFIYSVFTAKIVTPSIGKGSVGFVMAVFGAVDTIASLLMGKIADVWGGQVVITIGAISHVIFLVGYFVVLKLIPIAQFADSGYIIYISAGLWAVGDAAFNLFPNLMMSLFFTDNSEGAFSVLKFFQALGAVMPAVVGPLLSLEVIIACVFGFLVLAVICLLFLHYFVSPITSAGKEDEADPIN